MSRTCPDGKVRKLKDSYYEKQKTPPSWPMTAMIIGNFGFFGIPSIYSLGVFEDLIKEATKVKHDSKKLIARVILAFILFLFVGSIVASISGAVVGLMNTGGNPKADDYECVKRV